MNGEFAATGTEFQAGDGAEVFDDAGKHGLRIPSIKISDLPRLAKSSLSGAEITRRKRVLGHLVDTLPDLQTLLEFSKIAPRQIRCVKAANFR